MKPSNLENTLFLRGCIKKLNITCASAKNLFIQPLYSTKRYETNDSSRRIQKITALVSVSLDFMSKLNATRERERERNHREQIHPLENEKDERRRLPNQNQLSFPLNASNSRFHLATSIKSSDTLAHLSRETRKHHRHLLSRCIKHRLLLSSLH